MNALLDWQTAAALLCVGLALLVLTKRGIRLLKNGGRSGCGRARCDCAGQSRPAERIVELDVRGTSGRGTSGR